MPLLNLKLNGGIFDTCHTRESKNESDKVWNVYPYAMAKLLMQHQTFWPKPIATSNAIIKSYNNDESSAKVQPLVGLEFQHTLDPCLTLHPQIVSLYPCKPLSVPPPPPSPLHTKPASQDLKEIDNQPSRPSTQKLCDIFSSPTGSLNSKETHSSYHSSLRSYSPPRAPQNFPK
jgi:hypothetical protein